MNTFEADPRRLAVGRTLSQPADAYCAVRRDHRRGTVRLRSRPRRCIRPTPISWGFSSVVLTMVFGTYAVGVLTALLLAGRVPPTSPADGRSSPSR